MVIRDLIFRLWFLIYFAPMRSLLVLLILASACLLLTGLIRPAESSSPAARHSVPDSAYPAPAVALPVFTDPPSLPNHTIASPLSPAIANAVDQFRIGAPIFARHCADLHTAILHLDTRDHASLLRARQRLTQCRISYKRIESFLEYFFRSSGRIYNTAPKFEAEEGGMEYQSPIGLQVIEADLFEKNPGSIRKDLLQQSAAVASSAADLSSLLYDFRAGDAQLLESLRLELIRIITLDITGYDAPLLKSGIQESAAALRALDTQLQPFLQPGQPGSDSLRALLDRTLAYLRDHPDFDTFDRLAFLTTGALPLQRQLGLLIREKGLDLNTAGVLNDKADHLFSPDALDPWSFGSSAAHSGQRSDVQSLPSPALGRLFFNDRSLSGNGQRSCATCHSPEKMFTDGLTASAAFDGHGVLDRNTPTLLYSGLQHRQFWDGRASSLEEQIRTVLLDPREMNGDSTRLLQAGKIDNIAAAIAAYLRTLRPMNSPFDHYMNGEKTALTPQAIRGANLFMGRAQCATCHFAPLFNGLIPPYYQVTEFEVLGTTATDRLDRPVLSKDPGRYKQYPFEFFKGAFKTPTVRNTAVTGPYMHNGAFHSLEKVLDFYNKGGGAGLGLKVPSQTLPSTPLHLTQTEMKDIIAFINTLTDSLPLSLQN